MSYSTFTYSGSRKEILYSFCLSLLFSNSVSPACVSFLALNGLHPIAGSSRCEGSQVFVKEADVVIRGAREMARVAAGSLTECTDYCRSAEYF